MISALAEYLRNSFVSAAKLDKLVMYHKDFEEVSKAHLKKLSNHNSASSYGATENGDEALISGIRHSAGLNGFKGSVLF